MCYYGSDAASPHKMFICYVYHKATVISLWAVFWGDEEVSAVRPFVRNESFIVVYGMSSPSLFKSTVLYLFAPNRMFYGQVIL